MKKFNDPVEKFVRGLPEAINSFGAESRDDFARASRSPTLPLTVGIVVVAFLAFVAFAYFVTH